MYGISLGSQAQSVLQPQTGTAIDCSGCEGVLFVSLAGGALSVSQGNNADGSGATALPDASATVGAAGFVEVHKPRISQGRYLIASGAGVGTGGIIAIRYGVRDMPQTQPSNSKTSVSPTT